MKEKQNIGTDLEFEALALFAARPSLLETFLDLTESGHLEIRWNPLEDPIQWEAKGKPTEFELKRISALRVFRDKGYIESVTDHAIAEFSVIASPRAMAVREAYDRVPAALKERIKQEMKIQ